MTTGYADQQMMAGQRPTTLGARLASLTSHSLIHVALIALALIWLLPSLGLLVTSFRPRPDIAASGWWNALFTLRLTTANYAEVLSAGGMGRAFLNSLLITIPATFLPVTFAALAAFGFAWLRFPGRDTIFLSIVALMIVPIHMALVPVLKMFNTVGLTQGLFGIWLAHTAFGLPFAVFLLRNFFITLPPDLIEAARIDGASNFGIFVRLVLPLSVPAIAALTIFQFLGVWNDLLMSLVFVQNPDYLPLTVSIQKLLSTYGIEWHLLSAGAFLLMAMPLAVFFSLQRYFVAGLLAGSVK